MAQPNDVQDKKQARITAIALVVLLLALAVAGFAMLPLLNEFIATYFSPGLGLKDSAVIAFFVTLVVMVVMAIAAGDGLLGEIQFMLAGFLSFFVILWLMTAWIF